MELDSNDKLLLQRATLELEKANAVLRFLSDHFRDKYDLTSDHMVTPDGRIINQEPMVVPNGVGPLSSVETN